MGVFEEVAPAPCVFELVYFARPDSVVFSRGVHRARTAMGAELAKQDAEAKRGPFDVVVAVPDSGVPAALGYAKESGLLYEKAIIRSHYVGRTFILPSQDQRHHTVRLKLSVVKELVAGQRVVLVDDSIVRGNTARIIVDMVREAGAEEVHLRVASPPLHWPCYLGIDTPTREELIANRHENFASIAESLVQIRSTTYTSMASSARQDLSAIASAA